MGNSFGFIMLWIAIFGLVVAFWALVKARNAHNEAIKDLTTAFREHMRKEHGFNLKSFDEPYNRLE